MNSVLSPRPKTSESTACVEIIRCGVGDEIYCLEMSEVGSVLPVGDLRPPSGNDPRVVGEMESQGEKIPVYDLAKRLNRESKPSQEGHYIVLINHAVRRFGLRVDRVSRVIRVSPENVLPLPKPLDHIRSSFRGIVDFTRERQVDPDWRATRYLPGLSEPRTSRSNRRRDQQQMHLLLNPKTLMMDNPAKLGALPAAERLLRRYAAVAAVSQPRASRQLVVFPVGVHDDCPLLMGLSISQVVEITEPLPVVSVPGSRRNVSGFSHWRNFPVPILDLQASLDCRPAAETVSHWIIARDHQSRGLIALPVAGRVQSIRLPIDHRPCPLPAKSWSSFALGSFEFEACVLILPRLEVLSEFTGESAE